MFKSFGKLISISFYFKRSLPIKEFVIISYGIQIEFGDISNVLAIISAGDRTFEIERLIGALQEIKRIYEKDMAGMFDHEYIDPDVVLGPQEAFYHEKKSLPIEECVNQICGEFIMCYPPGIPILAPGERITPDIINYIFYYVYIITKLFPGK